MSPLLVEQRRVGERIPKSDATCWSGWKGCAYRAAMEEGVVARTTDLMLLRQRMLELRGAVTIALYDLRKSPRTRFPR